MTMTSESRKNSASVFGEARSETWRKRQGSITFRKFASSLTPDVFNEPRLSRVSTIKSSVSSNYEAPDGASASSYCGSTGDCPFDSVSNDTLDKQKKTFSLPNFFDGVDEKIWWKPVFENDELESLYQDSQEVSVRTLFRMACGFLTLASVTHAVFFGMCQADKTTVVGPACYALFTLVVLCCTYMERLHGPMEKNLVTVLAVSLMLGGLSTLSYRYEVFSPIGRFGIATIVLTVLYVFLPLTLPVAALLGLVFSLLSEILQETVRGEGSVKIVIMKIILHLCANFILSCISLVSEVYRRNTFWRIGRSLLYQDQLDFELALKEKMIHSVMPEIIASELLEIDDTAYQSIFKHDTSRFRPLMLHRMENVTILFADIVGFTKMSSKKTAEALVSLLNNLFNRFDKLSSLHGCEKISTLGDCYYCVAGCPTPCDDHADRCVRMGLAMCQAINEFCLETGEDVNMRVGIHTGTVLCGIVGVHRFKFDVFSNDVQLANQMESGGIAGFVHISQTTYDALTERSMYRIRDGDGALRNEQLSGVTTYLVSIEKLTNRLARSSSAPVLETDLRNAKPTTRYSFRQKARLVDSKGPGRRRWIDPNLSQTFTNRDSQKAVNTRSLLHVMSNEDLPQKAVFDLPDEEETITDLLKARDEAPRVKVRPSELAACDLLRITVTSVSVPDEKSRMEEDRKARLQEQRLVIQILRKTWERLIDLKKASSMELSFFSLKFIDEHLEALHRTQFKSPTGVTAYTTFDSPIFSYLLQVMLAMFTFVIFVVIFAVMFHSVLSAPWLGLLGFLFSFNLLVVFAVGNVCYVRYPMVANWFRAVVCNWWVAHTIVFIMLSSPVALVAANWPCCLMREIGTQTVYFNFFILQASLTTCILFTQFHRITKLTVAIGICILMILMVRIPCQDWTCYGYNPVEDMALNKTISCPNVVIGTVHNEVFLVFSVYLVLIIILNRQYEAASRLNFKSQLLAQVSFEEIQQLKEQADSLLSNLLPDHVCQKVRVTSNYSENHESAGVLFATIVNFSDFYSETWEGGIGCIRVLNELISDFDDLLCRPQFATVEKIKTIGATYMAASGLSSTPISGPYNRHDPALHLKALLEFAKTMQKTVEEFNENMVGYEFELRLGFNCGPVTAGVVGSTKLLYDIWGDTVNVASRMDSTGIPGRIQVPSPVLEPLEGCILATQREETVFVKGKGEMETYFIDSVIETNFNYHGNNPNVPFIINGRISPALFISGSASVSPTSSHQQSQQYYLEGQPPNGEGDELQPPTMRPSRSAPSRASMLCQDDPKAQYRIQPPSPVLNTSSRRSSQSRKSLGATNVIDTSAIAPPANAGGRNHLQKTFSLPSNASQRIANVLGHAGNA